MPSVVLAIWLSAVGLYLSQPMLVDGKTLVWIEKIRHLKPNEFGDFLAGVFAPPAFAILFLSFLGQKNENRELLSHNKKIEFYQILNLIQDRFANTKTIQLAKQENGYPTDDTCYLYLARYNGHLYEKWTGESILDEIKSKRLKRPVVVLPDARAFFQETNRLIENLIEKSKADPSLISLCKEYKFEEIKSELSQWLDASNRAE
ncbi:hypothetical protein MCEMSEM23_01571 [Rhabdaerophilaceae bacterium]